MSRIRNEPGIEWCVWYERTSSKSPKSRIYQSRPPAERFMSRLLSGERGADLAPIRYAALERREVGRWETVAVATETDDRSVRGKRRWRMPKEQRRAK